ncbi:hypothetical protein NE865_03128 [Phthorimaea operculella]|nr:hypothetical protein NE865_03128 [Phthorimaea operculella]
MTGTSKAHLLIILTQLVYLVAAQDVEKRLPQGFVGTRGKKRSYTNSEELEHFFKRKPQFFVGVKGKKTYQDNVEQDTMYYKRAPMGFVGMRGKKDLENGDYSQNQSFLPKSTGSLIGQIDYATNEDVKNFNSAMFNELVNEYVQYMNSVNIGTSQSDEGYPDERMTNEVDKRAAGIHQFFGVRGKKSIQNKRPYDLTFRGKFIGVRGKKDMKNDRLQELKVLLDGTAPWTKRKSQMGFFGMRGKKWDDNESNSEA